MPRATLKSGLAGLALVCAFTATLPGAVHAARPADSPVSPGVTGDTGKDCHVLRVQLRGQQPALGTCLDHTPPAGLATQAHVGLNSQLRIGVNSRPESVAHQRPKTYQGSCTDTDLVIFADTDRHGDKICFYATGFVNLTDFQHGWGGIYGSWNDIASSYYAGRWNGCFYPDINGNPPGSCWFYQHWEWDNFYATTIGNDKLSSLSIEY